MTMKTITIFTLFSLLALICSSCSTGTPEFTCTPTALPATDTQPPTYTFTPLPPTGTETPVLPTATETSVPPSATDTSEPSPTMTETEDPRFQCYEWNNIYNGSQTTISFTKKNEMELNIEMTGCGSEKIYSIEIPPGSN
jgi:hypothetical protein